MERDRKNAVQQNRLISDINGRFEDEYRPGLLDSTHLKNGATYLKKILNGREYERFHGINERNRGNCSNQPSHYENSKSDFIGDCAGDFFKTYGIISFLDD